MKEVNEELESSNPIWCADCGEWIEEPCVHEHPDPDELIQIQEAQDRKLDAPRFPQ